MSDDLRDFEIVKIDRRRNPRTSLRIRGFSGVQLETRDVKVGVSLFVPEIQFVRGSSPIMPCDFVGSGPTR